VNSLSEANSSESVDGMHAYRAIHRCHYGAAARSNIQSHWGAGSGLFRRGLLTASSFRLQQDQIHSESQRQ
jgi:hypothetical protein